MNARTLSPEKRALLVEGQDDRHVAWQIYDAYHRHEEIPEFGVIDKANLNELLKSVPGEIRAPGRVAIGIVVDADEDPERRWNEVVGCLQRAVKDFPCKLSSADVGRLCVRRPGGTILPSSPRVGVWMMPDNESTGELEDFVALMIPEDDEIWPLATRYIEDIPHSERKFRSNKMLKAKLFAWLASRKEPGRMGAAIGAGDLLVDGAQTGNFVGWLRGLFQH